MAIMKHFYEDIQGWFNFQQLYYTTIKSMLGYIASL